MAYDIIDYAILNAHKDFSKLPFSKVDGLIFSQLSYLNFDNLIPDTKNRSKGIYLSQVAETESENYEKIFPLERTAERNKKLLNAVAYSNRYGKIRVNYYENIFDIEKDTQFCALTFIFPNGDACIAFRGTDSTITGWKENFNMLFNSTVASHQHSVKYVERVAKKVKGNIILAGHSKGGNVAIYAGAMCNDETKKRITEIQSFDSPGFTKEFIESEQYIKTEEKIAKFVPEESMIGLLLNNRDNYKIIKSDGIGIFQHDPFMWQVENDDFVNGEKLYTRSQLVDSTFNDWVYNAEIEQREQFVESLFQMINAANAENATSFIDWTENLKNNSTLVYENIKDLDPETRTLVLKGFGSFFSAFGKNIKSTPKKILADTLKKIKEITKTDD